MPHVHLHVLVAYACVHVACVHVHVPMTSTTVQKAWRSLLLAGRPKRLCHVDDTSGAPTSGADTDDADTEDAIEPLKLPAASLSPSSCCGC